jgi:hypothetical protein
MTVADVSQTPLMQELARSASKQFTGCLTVADKDSPHLGRVYLYQGGIYAVQVEGFLPRVAERMKSAGLLDAAREGKILADFHGSMVDPAIGAYAVEQGWLDVQVLAAFHREFLLSALGAIASWTRVKIKKSKNETTNLFCSNPVPVEQITTALNKRADLFAEKWSQIAPHPDPSRVVPTLVDPSAVPGDAPAEIMTLVAHIDGRTNLDEIAGACGFTRMEAVVLLANGLVPAGAVGFAVGPASPMDPNRLAVPEVVADRESASTDDSETTADTTPHVDGPDSNDEQNPNVPAMVAVGALGVGIAGSDIASDEAESSEPRTRRGLFGRRKAVSEPSAVDVAVDDASLIPEDLPVGVPVDLPAPVDLPVPVDDVTAEIPVVTDSAPDFIPVSALTQIDAPDPVDTFQDIDDDAVAPESVDNDALPPLLVSDDVPAPSPVAWDAPVDFPTEDADADQHSDAEDNLGFDTVSESDSALTPPVSDTFGAALIAPTWGDTTAPIDTPRDEPTSTDDDVAEIAPVEVFDDLPEDLPAAETATDGPATPVEHVSAVTGLVAWVQEAHGTDREVRASMLAGMARLAQDDLATKRSALREAEESLQVAREALADALQEAEAATAKRDAIDEDVVWATEAVALAESKHAEAADAVAAAQAAVAGKNDQIAETRARIADLEAELEKARSQETWFLGELPTLEASADEAVHAAENAEQAVTAAAEQLNSLRSGEHEQAVTALDVAESKVASAQAVLARAEERTSTATQEAAQAELVADEAVSAVEQATAVSA